MLIRGADVIVPVGCRDARWLDALRKPVYLHNEPRKAGERVLAHLLLILLLEPLVDAFEDSPRWAGAA